MNNVGSMIDHTILKPNTSKEQVVKVCEEAKKYNFASVCVNPFYVKLVSEELKGTDVKVTSVIGFPLGSTTKEVKAFEAKEAIKNGANELDMVINVGALKDKRDEEVKEDIKAVVDVAADHAIVKVIIEACLLTEEEKVRACKLSKEAGADFVKTSTGFSTGGATVEDIKLMRETVGPDMGVKASGGVRDIETANAMIEAGATRIGASSSVAIVEGSKSDGEGY
ncbi:deoxyribose-phosphate aldolase [Sporosalibacterium faouarense]|uniref:deoxyribose-phosphate aldolase n=1 Tax=Sporosalibacterium faouarense TaxID=516123 RepID=UPI00141CE408|nr:deoxyribose-phosphate aldolase [Sporosalibacterium faouarense]MTI49073.1 deoxyribose-phosphate aldolase [Bacillota bacterium]